MKIQDRDYLGLNFLVRSNSTLGIGTRREVRDMVLRQSRELGWNTLETARRDYIVSEVLDDNKFSTYLVAETAQALAKQLKINTEEDLSILEDLDDEYCTYLLNKNEFIRFFRKGVNLYIYHFLSRQTEEAKRVQIEYFSIFIPYGTAALKKERHKELAEKIIRLILFIKLSEVEILELPVGKKAGGSRSSGKAFFNESSTAIKFVDSSWNKILVQGNSIGVRDYFRFQRYGIGLSKRKLILIRAHERLGYTRLNGSSNNSN